MKFVNTVTVTGADDSTDIKQLLALAKDFPFVEFGILLARDSMGRTRFPSSEWLNQFADEAADHNLNISGHLCGAWVRELLKGSWPYQHLSAIHPQIIKPGLFKRWQINTHGTPHKTKPEAVVDIIRYLQGIGQTVIFQYDQVNTLALSKAKEAGCTNIAALYDLSHGAGILPEAWPAPLPDIYCGYAGGLSPENVAAQLTKLENLVGDTAVWIDAETRLRSHDDSIFDLNKVRAFLKAAQPFVR